ncbi:helix-turn-helix domain-containing protein [Polaromonas sp. P1-6]|nr:helix-turn-helix domain-containing protein [Polaromonas sp. P1-6]UUZ69995.1 helix-turn-helix domain-containing protein [Polaromonas sp. P2-4]
MSSIFSGASTLTDVGNAIRLARKSQKLSQTELGKIAGLSRMPVYRIEAGQDISLRTLLSILSALRLGLQMQPLPQGMPSAQALQSAFAHLHAEDAE